MPRHETQAHLFHDDPEVLRALRGVRDRTGISVAVLIRQGIRLVLAQHGVTVKSPAVRVAEGG